MKYHGQMGSIVAMAKKCLVVVVVVIVVVYYCYTP